MIKSIIKHLLFGIGCGSTAFVTYGILLGFGIGVASDFFDNFTFHAIGFIIVGVGFSISGMAYETDSLPLLLKFAIHVVVGHGLSIFVGLNLGFISLESPVVIIIIIGINIIIFCRHFYWQLSAYSQST